MLGIQQERAIILIDGSNFYFKLRDLQLSRLLEFDFLRFAQFLVGNRTLVQATYCIGRYEDLYERIYLVSSDTDLLPAIKKAQEKGKFVE